MHSPSLRGRKQYISFPGRQLTSSSFPGRCLPSPWGRKQFSGFSGLSGRQAGRHSPSLRGRKQFISFPGRQLTSSSFPGRCSPSPRGRKQFSGISGKHSPSLWGRKQLSSLSGHSDRQASSCLPLPRGRRQLSGRSPFPVTAPYPKQAARSPQIPLLGQTLPKQATTSLQVRQAVTLQLGQAGIVPGAQSGTGPPGFPGEKCCLPGRQCWFLGRQPHTYPPNRLPQGSSPEDPNPKWVINLSSKL